MSDDFDEYDDMELDEETWRTMEQAADRREEDSAPLEDYDDMELDEATWRAIEEAAERSEGEDTLLEEPPGPGDLEFGSKEYIKNYEARLTWATQKRTKHKPREWQLEAAVALHLGRDVFVHAGTGFGKTLPFVMNCFLDPKLRIWLVSPLNALGNQQAKTFQDDWHLNAMAVNSTTNYKGLYKDIKNGKYQIIISSIEAFLDTTRLFPAVLSPELAAQGDQILILDEAHCMDSWGKGFRPLYRKIGDLKAILTHKVPFMAATATANAVARAGIPKALHFGPNSLEINLGNHRGNLAYSVHKLSSVSNCAKEILHYFPSKIKIDGFVLIFVNSRPMGTEVLTELRQHFIPELRGHIDLYHSSRSELDKKILANGFEKKNGFFIMGSSDSLTMGLDYRNISMVIQLQSPEDLATTLQRLGRGGRDPKITCEAVLMAEESLFEDTKLGQRRMKERVKREENKPQNPKNKKNQAPDAHMEVSDAMLRFINTSGCRVKVLDDEFDNPPRLDDKPCLCDNCKRSRGELTLYERMEQLHAAAREETQLAHDKAAPEAKPKPRPPKHRKPIEDVLHRWIDTKLASEECREWDADPSWIISAKMMQAIAKDPRELTLSILDEIQPFWAHKHRWGAELVEVMNRTTREIDTEERQAQEEKERKKEEARNAAEERKRLAEEKRMRNEEKKQADAKQKQEDKERKEAEAQRKQMELEQRQLDRRVKVETPQPSTSTSSALLPAPKRVKLDPDLTPEEKETARKARRAEQQRLRRQKKKQEDEENRQWVAANTPAHIPPILPPGPAGVLSTPQPNFGVLDSRQIKEEAIDFALLTPASYNNTPGPSTTSQNLSSVPTPQSSTSFQFREFKNFSSSNFEQHSYSYIFATNKSAPGGTSCTSDANSTSLGAPQAPPTQEA